MTQNHLRINNSISSFIPKEIKIGDQQKLPEYPQLHIHNHQKWKHPNTHPMINDIYKQNTVPTYNEMILRYKNE